jgi:hypothetical protein
MAAGAGHPERPRVEPAVAADLMTEMRIVRTTRAA